jgi:hypothetical protein
VKTDSAARSLRLPDRRTNVFISYSHEDKKWLDQLQKMLKPSVRMGEIILWDDTQIRAGDQWYTEIQEALAAARVAVLLVSAAFLASDFITEHELPHLHEAAKQGRLTIIWVALKPSMYKETLLAKIQAAHDSEKPLSTLSAAKRDIELKKICEKIKYATAPDKAFEVSPPKASLKWPDDSPPLELASFKEIQSVPPEELVDFEKQQASFRGMLDHSSQQRLMFVQAPGTNGKTSLLRMMRLHCEQRGIPLCWIDFRKGVYDNPDFELTQVICKQLGLLSRNLNRILAGGSWAPLDLRQPFLKESLRRAFLADLRAFAKKKRGMVFFFDSLEAIRTEEETWLLDALLSSVKNEKLKDVVIVTAGHRWPKIEKRDWERCAHLVEGLPSMSVKHIKLYARKVGVRLTHQEAEFCWRICERGNPLMMGTVVKNLQGKVDVKP